MGCGDGARSVAGTQSRTQTASITNSTDSSTFCPTRSSSRAHVDPSWNGLHQHRVTIPCCTDLHHTLVVGRDDCFDFTTATSVILAHRDLQTTSRTRKDAQDLMPSPARTPRARGGQPQLALFAMKEVGGWVHCFDWVFLSASGSALRTTSRVNERSCTNHSLTCPVLCRDHSSDVVLGVGLHPHGHLGSRTDSQPSQNGPFPQRTIPPVSSSSFSAALDCIDVNSNNLSMFPEVMPSCMCD